MANYDRPDPHWMKCGDTDYLRTTAVEITEDGMYKISSSDTNMYLQVLEAGDSITGSSRYNAVVQMHGTYAPEQFLFLQKGQKIISNTTYGTYTRMVPV